MKKMSKLTWALIALALVAVGYVVYKKRQAASTTKTSTGIASETASSSTAATSIKMVNTVAGPLLVRG